jgi:hypothetical protein
MEAYRRNKSIAPLFHKFGTRWRWIADSTSRPLQCREYEAGWAPERVWVLKKKEIPCLCQYWNPRSSSSWCGHYTNWAVLAPNTHVVHSNPYLITPTVPSLSTLNNLPAWNIVVESPIVTHFIHLIHT